MMLLVDPVRFPGPAIWQGVMLALAPLFFYCATRKQGAWFGRSVTIYILFGMVLLAFLVVRRV